MPDADNTSTPWLNFDTLPNVMPRWLIDGVIPAESLVCLYGKRGQGKTFLALDWACCIATGTAWCGKVVQPGRIAYLLAERPDGLKRRLRGWLRHKKSGGEAETEINRLSRDGIHWLQFTQRDFFLDVENSEKGDGNADLIKMLEAEFPPPVDDQDPAPRRLSLLVIDPLVAFMEGSENETRDMQAFVRGCIRIISRLKCSLLLVHHEGKGNVNNILGARGSSALEAGMDTVIYLAPRDKNQIAELRITKQREDEADQDRHLQFVGQISPDNQKLGTFPIEVPPPPKEKKPPEGAATKDDKVPDLLDEILQIAKDLESKGEPVTVSGIIARISKVRGRGSQKVRDGVKALEATKKLQILHPRNGATPAVYSCAVPSQDDLARTAEKASRIEGSEP